MTSLWNLVAYFNMLCIVFAAFLASGQAREVGMRAVPGVRDSIINLGKMDVSFYMSGKPEDILHKHFQESSEFINPCPCSYDVEDDFRFLDNVMNRHSSQHQHPSLSTKCCQKNHEDIIFTFTPKIYPKHSNSAQDIPFPLNLLMNPSKVKLAAAPKRNIEVVLFPKRKDIETNVRKTTKLKKETKLVGGEEQNSKKLDLMPPVPQVQNNLIENTDIVKDNENNNNKKERHEKNKL